MVKIIATGPDLNDATSFYRAAWPLSRMAKADPNFSVEFKKAGGDVALGWSDISTFDVLFIQRAFKNWNLELMEKARECGLKLWIDYDDDLFSIEPHNPAFKTYADPRVKDAIVKIVNKADLVTFSTEALKSAMRFENKNCHVIRNSTDFRLLGLTDVDKIVPLDKTIFWRGSRTHENDLFQYAEWMGKIAKEFTDWKFVFLGDAWWGLSKYIPKKQMVFIPPVFLPKFFGFMQAIRPTICIVPLSDSVFNRSKSNIAWQEATIANSPCLVPRWPEWDVAGAVTYSNETEFYTELRSLILDEERRAKFAAESCVTIKRDFNLKDRTQERIGLVKKLCSM